MRRLVPLAAVLALLLMDAAAVAAPPTKEQILDEALLHEGRKRTYRLLLPRGFDKTRPVPLVLALHGGGGTATQLDRSTNGQFRRAANRRGWVVVFPQGIAKGWNDGRPLTSRRDRQRKGVDDVAFLSTLIDHLHKTRGIDRSRVYATGISNGGFMSFRLGLELSQKIAAIAPVTANLAKVHDGKRPRHPVGLLVINGTKDPLVPYAGGEIRVLGKSRGKIHSTDESLRRWAAFNGCAPTIRTQPLPDVAKGDGARAYVHTWSGCKGGAGVELIRVQGGGHTWPGGTQYLPKLVIGTVCRDFDAVKRSFAFFARHRRVIRPAEKAAK